MRWAREPRNRDSGSSGWLFNLLGGLASALALISVVQKWFDVGLAPILADVLRAYRDLIHPIAEFLLSWLYWIWPDWNIPILIKDLLALSMFGGALLTRYEANKDRNKYKGRPEYERDLITVASVLFYGLTGIGLIVFASFPIVFIFYIVSKYKRNYPPEGPELDHDIVVGFLTGSAGAAAFFMVNSQLG